MYAALFNWVCAENENLKEKHCVGFWFVTGLTSQRSEQHSLHTVPGYVLGDSDMNCCPLSCCFVGLRKRVLRERGREGRGRAERAANHNHMLCTWINGCTLFQAQLFLALPSLAVCMAQCLHRMGQVGRDQSGSFGPTSAQAGSF